MEFKIIKFLNGSCIVHGLNHAVPMGSVMLCFKNGAEILCTDFRQKRSCKIKILCYDPISKLWKQFSVKNEYTELLWKIHRESQRKSKKSANYAALMHHDRRHKSGSGGSRFINNRMITDYECSKNPLHDFRRSMYVTYN